MLSSVSTSLLSCSCPRSRWHCSAQCALWMLSYQLWLVLSPPLPTVSVNSSAESRQAVPEAGGHPMTVMGYRLSAQGCCWAALQQQHNWSQPEKHTVEMQARFGDGWALPNRLMRSVGPVTLIGSFIHWEAPRTQMWKATQCYDDDDDDDDDDYLWEVVFCIILLGWHQLLKILACMDLKSRPLSYHSTWGTVFLLVDIFMQSSLAVTQGRSWHELWTAIPISQRWIQGGGVNPPPPGLLSW